MTHSSIGTDTSIVVRLATGEPRDTYLYCVDQLRALIASGFEIVASNQVIGEAYMALQHHYGATRADARAELHKVLTSGLIAPLNGLAVLDALTASPNPGLFDRLIANGYSKSDLGTLTLDRRMASLPGARLL